MSTASVASGLRMRPAGPADAPFLTDLRNRLASHFLSGVPATVGHTLVMLEESWTYVSKLDGQRVGAFALTTIAPGTLEFGRFMLEPSLHGNGYGRLMLLYAIEEARRLGAHSLHLVTKPQNWAACELYEEAGFEVTQVRMELRLD